jgi:hypothetical protein
MKYTIKSYLGGLQPNLLNVNNRCFGNVVLQMIYRATDIREHILKSTYTDPNLLKIQDDLRKMKEIDEQTKDKPKPIKRMDNNFKTCDAIWKIENNSGTIGKVGYAHRVLQNILEKVDENLYMYLLFSSYNPKKVYNDNWPYVYNENKDIEWIIPGEKVDINFNKYFFINIHQPFKLRQIIIIENIKYKLISFFRNTGEHFICYVLNPNNNTQWLEYNDLNPNINDIDINTINIPYDLIGSSVFCYERIDQPKKVIELICETIKA